MRAAEEIDFGDPVFGYDGDDVNGYTAKQDTATITLDADLIASNTITTTVTIDGVAQSPVATLFDTSHDNTMDLHEAALEAAISSLEVTLTDPTDNRQFTLLKKGSNINLVTSVVTGGASQAGITIAYTTSQIFRGFAAYTAAQCTSVSVGSYVVDDAINLLTFGRIWTNSSKAVNANTKGYVIWSTTDQGKITDAVTDNYDANIWIRSTRADAGLVLVEVNGIQRDATP